MAHSTRIGLALVSVLWASACASTEQCPAEPVVPIAPCVSVQLDSTVISPDGIQFVGRVVITNEMRGPLDLERVDYCALLHDQPFLTESFAELEPMSARGRQTVTLPFQVTQEQLTGQLDDVLAEESARVALRGTVYPIGFEPIAFEATKVVPMPKMPNVSVEGARGNPLDGAFTVRLGVHNPNSFPLSFESVDSFLELNGKRYSLLKSECFVELAPGGRGTLALTMEQTRGKGLSVLVNLAKHRETSCAVGGSIRCRTPHGLFLVPLEVRTSPAAALDF
ncbi:MAG: hypothetical protein IPJ77_12540 [Planctomycetes bacterium]|nr:hypothetical protein [Planctomycetota bacterium]